jgi:hypothetical protein
MSANLPHAEPLSSERYALHYEMRPCVSLTLFISSMRGCLGMPSSVFVAQMGNGVHVILSQLKLDCIGQSC